MSSERIAIMFIVNGEDVPIEANLHEPLAAARNKALAESKNTGRAPAEWEVRNEGGIPLDASLAVGSFNFQPGVRLFLTLKVGAGGGCS